MTDNLDRLKREAKASREFVNTAAHELQGALAMVKWQLESLLTEQPGSLSTKQRAGLGQAHAVNQEMIRLVKNLLFMARRQRGVKINKEPADLAVLLGDIGRRYRSVAFDPPGGEALPTIDVDRELLAQAVDNLVGALLQGGTPEAGVRLAVRQDQGAVVLAISSQGSAPPAKWQALRETFSGKEDAKAGGIDKISLSLAVAKKIIVLHGGTVTLEPAGDTGALVSVKLPL
jgi:two-component system, OmpR family, sensor kinase